MPTRLVLLTGEYPFGYGDVNFVRHEIDALAAAYDDVLVFNYARRSEPAVPVPPNVRFLGNLFERSRWRSVRALLSPRFLLVLLRALRSESRAGRLRGHVRQTLLSSLQGMRVARHPDLMAAVSDEAADTTVYAFWGMGGALGIPWLRRTSGGAVVRLHRFDLYEDEGDLPLRASLFAAVRRVLTISDDGRRYLLDRFASIDALAGKVEVSRLGTADPGPVHRPPRTDVATIVTCSSVIPVKRVERVADALALLGGTRPVRWVHFGDGPLMAGLRTAAERVATEHRKVELRGATGNADILDFYRENRIDLFVNVSSSEGVPVSIMEAMSFGIPVVATDVGGTGEIVRHDLGSGELIPRDFTDEQLADTIARMLEADDARYDPRSAWERFADAAANSRALVDLLRAGN